MRRYGRNCPSHEHLAPAGGTARDALPTAPDQEVLITECKTGQTEIETIETI